MSQALIKNALHFRARLFFDLAKMSRLPNHMCLFFKEIKVTGAVEHKKWPRQMNLEA